MLLARALQGGWWGPMHYGPYGTGWGVMMIGMALIWVIVGALVVWLVVRASASAKGEGGGATPDRSETIVRERYARGEIDRDTYERLLADLRK